MQKVKLNNGLEMPILGFGVYQIPNEETAQVVSEAISTGYRLFDTAQAYLNEEGVGIAIKNSGISREEFFIVTKIWISNYGEEKAYQSILSSLEKLQTEYIDLLLLHQPFNDYYSAYRAMEMAYREGKVKAIGVSNFYPDRFVDLCKFVEVKPAINQIEMHVFNQHRVDRKYFDKYSTQIMSWGPFAEGKNNIFLNGTLVSVGEKYGKTSAQIALRFLTQEGVVVIPKTVKRERMYQNFNIFDFELGNEDIEKIRALDLGKSLFFSHQDPKTVEMISGLVID